MKSEFLYVNDVSKISELFDTISKLPVPEKFTYRYLAKIGFASSLDRELVTLLKFLGFLSSNGIPTAPYLKLHSTKNISSIVIARTRAAFEALYNVNSNVESITLSELSSLFAKFEGIDATISEKYALTFQTLVNLKEINNESIIVAPKASASFKNDKRVYNYSININVPALKNLEEYKELLRELKQFLKD